MSGRGDLSQRKTFLEDQREFIEINAELSKVCRASLALKATLDDADEWADVTEKKQHLER